MPSLVRGLQPDGRRDDVDGPVAHDQPVVLRSLGLSVGDPQWRNTRITPWNVGVAEGGLERRDPTLVDGGARSEFTLSTLVEVAGKDDSAQLYAKVADEQK